LFPIAELSPESIKKDWSKITQFEKGATNPSTNEEMMGVIMRNLENKSLPTKMVP